MIDGISSSPFSGAGLPPLAEEAKTGTAEKVINYSREKYASRRQEVEEKIMSWHMEDDKREERPAASAPAPRTSAAPYESRSAAPRTASTLTDRPARPAFSRPSAPAPRTVAPASARTDYPSSARSAAPAMSAPVPVRPAAVRPAARSGYDAVCDNCGKLTTIAFVPDGIRPVYCKDCLSQKREERRQEVDNRRLAKQKEKESLAEETAAEAASPLTLADLGKRNPVDFRGREIKTEKPVRPPAGATAASDEPSANNRVGQEQNLSEGEEVTIGNNQF
jgi:CxxC-x17-CxxC domain-containing protein